MLHGKLKINKQGGFTLVELMVVIVIVGILASIAVPAYNDSVRKGRRADAKSTLTTVAARMEQYFMDNKTFEQPAVSTDMVGELAGYLIEGLDVKLTFFGDEPLDIELPTSVELEVVEAEAAARGDTATGVTKKVVCQTGLEVQTPAFIEVGDTIKIDTRSGEYLTRV